MKKLIVTLSLIVLLTSLTSCFKKDNAVEDNGVTTIENSTGSTNTGDNEPVDNIDLNVGEVTSSGELVESVGVNLTVSGATEDEIFQDIDNLLNEIVNQAATDVTNKIVDEANKTLSELKVDSESTSNE